MPDQYRYELRRGDEVVATGQLTLEDPMQVGERITIAGREGIVRSVAPELGQPGFRVVVQLVRE